MTLNRFGSVFCFCLLFRIDLCSLCLQFDWLFDRWMNTSQYPHVLHVVEIILHGTFVTERGSSASSDQTTNQTFNFT
jgi:hypothetical protein